LRPRHEQRPRDAGEVRTGLGRPDRRRSAAACARGRQGRRQGDDRRHDPLQDRAFDRSGGVLLDQRLPADVPRQPTAGRQRRSHPGRELPGTAHDARQREAAQHHRATARRSRALGECSEQVEGRHLVNLRRRATLRPLDRTSGVGRSRGVRRQMADYAVIDPASGETIKEYPTISDDDLRAAIGRVDDAWHTWSFSTTAEERAALMGRVAELHNEQTDHLAEIIVREMGKPIEAARGEVEFSVAIYQFYADNGAKLMADTPIDLLDGDGSAVVRRSPYGPLLGIMPWNYPYYQVARFAGPNLVNGNP